MIDFDTLTVGDAARMIEEVTPDNNYIAMNYNGVLVLVAKGAARRQTLNSLKKLDSLPPRKPKRK